MYRDFREHFADPEYAEALLRVVIRRCQFYGAEEVISASLALGVMLGDASRHQDVLKTFSDLTMKHERDPRTWAALPSALFHLARYEQSLQALKNAGESILKHYREESGSHMPEVVHNIANLLIVLSRYAETQAEIDRLSSEDQSHSFIRALRGRLLCSQGQYRNALAHLEEACAAWCGGASGGGCQLSALLVEQLSQSI